MAPEIERQKKESEESAINLEKQQDIALV